VSHPTRTCNVANRNLFSERRRAQHPRDPLGLLCKCGEIALEYPAPCVGKWIIKCDLCGIFAMVGAAGRPDDPHTVRLACKLKGRV
jgi:hypothetical protein